jgi:DNA transposition AAA+ family ATPase
MIDWKTRVESTLVPHTAFQNGSRRLKQVFAYAAGAAEPICLPIVGESGTGKTRMLEELCAEHPQERTPEGLTIPILRVRTPSKPSVKSLAEVMLGAMKDPKSNKGTENEKTERLQTLMGGAGTRMVMIDEFQHFYDKVSHRVAHHVADWLKILVDSTSVALVVAGLPSCMSVLHQNEQLARRFHAPCEMPRFLWSNDDHREEFIAILSAFQESLGAHFDLPKLDTDEMAFRFYCGTGGLIGYLTKVLRQSVWNALDDGRTSISLAQLESAHKESVWNTQQLTDMPSPFGRAFVSHPSEDVLAKVQTIGAPAPEVPRPRGRRAKANKVSQLLIAA